MKCKFKYIFVFVIGLIFFSGCKDKDDDNSEKDECLNYSITYNANGGKILNGNSNQIICSVDDIIFPTVGRYGYTFDGWNVNINEINGDTEIKANWKPIISIDRFEVIEDEKILVTVNNEVDTFSFINRIDLGPDATWRVFSDIEGKNEIITKTSSLIPGNNNFYIYAETNEKQALYTVVIKRLKMITIIFTNAGDFPVETIEIQEGDTLKNIKEQNIIPNKTGYHFLGWSHDLEGQFFESTNIKGLWDSNIYKLVLNSDNENSVETLYILYDQIYTLPTPQKNGYEFVGWYDSFGVKHSNTSKKWIFTNDLELNAKWEAKEYVVTYYYNYDYDVVPGLKDVKYGFDFTLPTIERDGYVFCGWYTSDGQKIENGIWKYDRNLSVYAKWEEDEFVITLNSNGGTVSENEIINITFGSEYELPIPEREGYIFDGWYNFDNEKIFETGKYIFAEDLFLNAKWICVKYNITYELDGGLNEQNPDYFTIENDEFVLNSPTKKGYKFLGWTDEKNTNPMLYYTINTVDLKEVYVIANWELEVYEINYELGDGDFEIEFTNFTILTDDILITGSPKKEKNIFTGWTTKESVSAMTEVVIPKGTVGDISLKANYIYTENDIYYIDDGNDLLFLSKNKNTWNSDVYLLNNIEMLDIQYTPIGNYSNPYTGTFYGNHHTIRNLSIFVDTESYSLVGMFGAVENSTIKNLRLSDVKMYVDVNWSDTKWYVTTIGGLVGIACGEYVVIKNVDFQGSLTTEINKRYAYNDSVYIGGVIGESTADSLNIEKVSSNLIVSGASHRYQYVYIGGLVGMTNGPFEIYNSMSYFKYDTTDISQLGAFFGGTYVGVLVLLDYTVKNSYAIGETEYKALRIEGLGSTGGQGNNGEGVVNSFSSTNKNKLGSYSKEEFNNYVINIWSHEVWSFKENEFPTLINNFC